MDPVTDGGAFDDARQRILREVVRELERHPIVRDARGHPPSRFTEVRADLAPERWGHEVRESKLRVKWRPLEPPEFAFHYSEPGFDCGWHREPNPHVDSAAHYQEREDAGEYVYEPIEFQGETGTQLVWEVMDRLRRRLGE